jgi:hypothetical protein
MKIYKALLLFLLLVGNAATAQQNYSVKLIATVSPPNSPYLADYTYANALQLNLILNGRTSYAGYLKIKLESVDGRGIVLQTRDSYRPLVDLGPSQTFTGVELAEYFKQENLDFVGYSRQQYLKTKRIPDGIYRLSFSFVDQFRPDVLVSNVDILSQKTLRVFALQPPIINLPLHFATINPNNQSAQPVGINWLRPANTPFNPEYEVVINELRPDCQSQYNDLDGKNQTASRISQGEIFNCLGPEIYRTTTTSLSYNYGMQGEPMLGLGKWYAVRIQARDPQGRTLFINNGVSQTRVFRYGKPCPVPARLRVKALNPYQVQVDWDALPDHTGYTVHFKREGDAYKWYPKRAISNRVQIDDMQPGEYYSFKLVADCNAFGSEPTAIVEFRMPTPTPTGVECGKPFTADLSNQKPIASLKVGDKIMAADFEFTLTELKPLGSGWFAGKGYTHVKFFKGARVFVKFDRIKVNTDKRLIDGEMTTSGVGAQIVPDEWRQKYLSFTNEITNLFDEIERGLDKIDQVVGKIDQVLKKVEQWVKNYNGADKAELLETIEIGKKAIEDGKKDLKNGKVADGLKKLKDGSGKVVGAAAKMVKNTLQKLFRDLKDLLKEILQELKAESKRLLGKRKEEKKDKLIKAATLLASYNQIDSTAWANEPLGAAPDTTLSLSSQTKEVSKTKAREIKASIDENTPNKPLGNYVDALVALELEQWNFNEIGTTLQKNLQTFAESIKKEAPELIKSIGEDLLNGKNIQEIKNKLKAFVKKRFDDAKQGFLKQIKQKRN